MTGAGGAHQRASPLTLGAVTGHISAEGSLYRQNVTLPMIWRSRGRHGRGLPHRQYLVELKDVVDGVDAAGGRGRS